MGNLQMETTVIEEQETNSSFSYVKRINTDNDWSSKKQHFPKLALYYSDNCPYSLRVTDYLNKINKAIEIIDISESLEAKDQLLSIGGKSQVPCLIIDGKALYESLDIIRWISENKDDLPNLDA